MIIDCHGHYTTAPKELEAYYDDTKRYVDAATGLSSQDKGKIFEGNARRVYSRLNDKLAAMRSK
jgi:hypothetical protein